MAKLVKDRLPDAVTVIGGVHVTALPRETLVEFPEFDLAVYGEGEVTFAELCLALDSGRDVSGIDGLAWRESGQVRLTNPRARLLDLDALPFPAWDLLPRAPQLLRSDSPRLPVRLQILPEPGRQGRARPIGGERPSRNWSGSSRPGSRPPSTSATRSSRSTSVARRLSLKAIVDRGFHDRIKWGWQTHVRFVDEEVFALMGRSNPVYVALGIETGDEEVLKRMGKGTTVDMILNARKLARKHGVPVLSLMILGHPHETLRSIWNTIRLAARLNAEEVTVGIMTPFPGTEVAALAARGEAGYKLLSVDWDDYQKQFGGVLQFANLSASSIAALHFATYACVFLWNLRFLDFARFAWKYRAEGWALVSQRARGVFGGRGRHASPPPPRVRREAIAEASAVWREWQVSELGRARSAAYRK